MFDIGWSELVVIGIVALIAIGPKELPGVLRALGQWMGKIKRMASEFQGQFQEAMREAEVADLKKQFDDAAQAAQFGMDDPLEAARKTIQDTIETPPASSAPSKDNSETAPAATPSAPESPAAEHTDAEPSAPAAKESGAA